MVLLVKWALSGLQKIEIAGTWMVQNLFRDRQDLDLCHFMGISILCDKIRAGRSNIHGHTILPPRNRDMTPL